MIKLNLSPLTKKKIERFKSIRRGYISSVILSMIFLLSLFAEVFISNRALLVKYNGNYYFPTYGSIIPGTTLGESYEYETNYRELKKKFIDSKNYVIMPLVPYSAKENDLIIGKKPPPLAPSIDDKHYLGTDETGRDIVARLIYGFRIAILFSLLLLIVNYVIGVSVGCLMGFLGGRFDLIMQRVIEIWSNIPFLYVVIIISSIIVPNFYTLISIMAFFGWMHMTWYMRTSTYKQKARDYVLAAKSLGASNFRIIFHHILPNSISVIITFIPFSIASGITALTSLDYLGFGLPPPTPSWGEMLRQGIKHINDPWILLSVLIAMAFVLVMVTFIGEAIREAFDPRRYTYYK